MLKCIDKWQQFTIRDVDYNYTMCYIGYFLIKLYDV